MPLRVLITGVTGFAGSHLAERLVASGGEVHGFAFEDPPYANLAGVAGSVRMHRGDVTSLPDLRRAVSSARPDVVVHLAGQAVPTLAEKDPSAAMRVNVLGTAAVLAAVEEHAPTRVVLASSGEVYGAAEGPLVDEAAPVRPANTYAATKVAAEALARDLAERTGRGVVIIRATNQVGPRQHPGLAASAFAKQIAEAEVGAAPPLVRHGSLDAWRDFVDVRDMADAYARAAAITEGGVHVFNVGTGRAVRIAEVLATLLALARVEVRAELDPERVRAGVSPAFALDAERFRARTGWAPRIPLATSLRDLLDHWRAVVNATRTEARI